MISILSGDGIKLVNSSLKHFFVYSINNESYLLAKANHNQPREQHVGFIINGKSFYSTFLRHVNLSYCSKLSTLLSTLNFQHNRRLSDEWLILYQIHSLYSIPMACFSIKHPVYGRRVTIQSKQGILSRRVSNLFKQNNQFFYFLSSAEDDCYLSDLNIILDQSYSLVGVLIKLNGLSICVPFHSILSQNPGKLCIDEEIIPILKSTCYLSYYGSYCTGVLCNSCILTARHLLPSQQQLVGTKVSARFYPFKTTCSGVVSKVGLGTMDLLQIQLTGLCLNFAQEQEGGQAELGEEVYSVGFGKFSYDSSIFSLIEIVLPTLEEGHISKIIRVHGKQVFLKTDATLTHGFSGSGLWVGGSLIGMAIFVIFSNSNSKMFPRHNFSYCFSFLKEFANPLMEEGQSSIQNFLQNFDKVNMRKKIIVIPKPHL